ncbi:hypothetical protein C5167_029458 [Papaver somniferum]|nr:hypothetical protein C5167_029458 [Papaver somniferum]
MVPAIAGYALPAGFRAAGITAKNMQWHLDLALQRGKPLYLNEERYATLTNMVASHGLDQSSDAFR